MDRFESYPGCEINKTNYPTRVQMATGSVTGWIVLDQIRSVDKTRLCNMEEKLSQSAIESVKNVIREMLVD